MKYSAIIFGILWGIGMAPPGAEEVAAPPPPNGAVINVLDYGVNDLADLRKAVAAAVRQKIELGEKPALPRL